LPFIRAVSPFTIGGHPWQAVDVAGAVAATSALSAAPGRL